MEEKPQIFMMFQEMFASTNSPCFGEALETSLPQFLMIYVIKHIENKNMCFSFIARNTCHFIGRSFIGMNELTHNDGEFPYQRSF